MNIARWVSAWLLDRVIVVGFHLRYLISSAVPVAYSRGERAPVMLVQGAYENWQFLRPLGDRLNSLGHPVFVVPELRHNRGPVGPSTDIVARYLVEHELRRVIIVAHSKGGIMGKQLMVTDGVAERIDRMVAINAPFSGSRLARLVPRTTLGEFTPTNGILSALARHTEANSRIVSIFSRLDPVILEGCRLEGARNIELPLSGHFRPLTGGALLDVVVGAVEDAQSPTQGTE